MTTGKILPIDGPASRQDERPEPGNELVPEPGNEADRANAATMQCAFRTTTEPGRETICAAPANRSFARCRVCQGVIFARCNPHGGSVEVVRLRREHEEDCAKVYAVCRVCFVAPVDRSLAEEVCVPCTR